MSAVRDRYLAVINRSIARRRHQTEQVTHGTTNVFADLGYRDAPERRSKLQMAHVLNRLLEAQRLTQAEAAKILGVSQPKVSALRNYKLAGFSIERLMTLLTAVGHDVEIVVKKKPRSRRAARITVVAAPG
jgi:predicted XRE-type DNA-binding protein